MFRRFRPMKPTIIPRLVIAQRVIDKIALAASKFVEDETGEALIGVVKPGVGENPPTIYVLDTIAPDDSAIREAHTFQQGDDLQAEMHWWYHQNWELRREKTADKQWDLPLKHLGDWHRQPGHMIAPSGGDLMTALDMLDDDESDFDFLLAPIVTLDHPPTTGAGHDVNYLTVEMENGGFLRIDFWYIDQRSQTFLPILPTLQTNEYLPELVPYPWHLVNDDRFRVELNQLKGDGLFTAVMTWNADGVVPLEICLMLGRQGAKSLYILCTDHDYPQSAPVAYTAPFMTLGKDEVMYDMMARMWPNARRITVPGWQWNQDKYLIDFVHAIEAHLGIHKPEPEPDPATDETETPDTIPVDEDKEETQDVG